ncbi:Mitogen-activated protein kinase kinase kinase [Bertholletia excelsa]
MESLTPTVWQRGKTLGKGAFGVVSLAQILAGQTSDLPAVMAVKSAVVENSRSLRHEESVLGELQPCPHIIRCFGSNVSMEQGAQLYNLFLEFAAGGSLADVAGDIPESDARLYTKYILMGLRHIHEQGYVHCDIKPDNILLVQNDDSSTKTLKIADFGFSLKVGKRVNKLRGTPPYQAPESILRREYGTEVDIWALGCSVLELMTGKLPWNFEKSSEIPTMLDKIGFTEELPEIPSGLSTEARDFLGKCLIRDSKSRWTADMLLRHPFVKT